MGQLAARHGRKLDARTAKRVLWVVIAAGLVARLAVALGYDHHNFDMESFTRVAAALRSDPLDVYATVGHVRWPYPPTFFSWVLVASWLDDLGLAFSSAFKLISIAADAVLALVVHDEVRRSGRSPMQALAAGTLVALGPTFAVNTAWHGQIDSSATLPAVLAVVAWRRARPERRALAAGLLIGLAASIKQPAGLVLLALLPLCGSPREAARLIGGAAAVPVIVTAPFFLSTPSPVLEVFTSGDVPGVGGLHLFTVLILESQRLTDAVETRGLILLGFVLAATFALLWARRPVAPALAATVLWLGFYAVAPSFFFGYLVWGLPFFLLAGYLWSTAALMALVLVPQILFESGRGMDHLGLYKWMMTAAWVALICAFVWEFVRILRRERAAGDAEPLAAPT